MKPRPHTLSVEMRLNRPQLAGVVAVVVFFGSTAAFGARLSFHVAGPSVGTCLRNWNKANSPGPEIAKTTLVSEGPRLNEPASALRIWVGVTHDPANGNRVQCTIKFVFSHSSVAESDGYWSHGRVTAWSQQGGPYLFGKPTYPPALNARLTPSGHIFVKH
jgi:hypothetical protein